MFVANIVNIITKKLVNDGDKVVRTNEIVYDVINLPNSLDTKEPVAATVLDVKRRRIVLETLLYDSFLNVRFHATFHNCIRSFLCLLYVIIKHLKMVSKVS